MPSLIIQRFSDQSSSVETRHARHLAMMERLVYRNALQEELATLGPTWQDAVPIGNVPFVRSWAAIAGKHLPNPDTYPAALRRFLHRHVEQTNLGHALTRQTGFIKPVAVKMFDGFVLGDPSEHAQEQMSSCSDLPSDTPVWWSETVHFAAEFRCYFADAGTLAGYARYDAGDDDSDLSAHITEVQSMARALNYSTPFSLDVGLLRGGQLALVEHNDCWALGLYQGMAPNVYLDLLVRRWESFEPINAPVYATNYAPT